MGHLVNPITYRVGTFRYWNNIWSSQASYIYSSLVAKDIQSRTYLEKLFRLIPRYFYRGILFWSIKVFRTADSVNFIIYSKVGGLNKLKRVLWNWSPKLRAKRLKLSNRRHSFKFNKFNKKWRKPYNNKFVKPSIWNKHFKTKKYYKPTKVVEPVVKVASPVKPSKKFLSYSKYEKLRKFLDLTKYAPRYNLDYRYADSNAFLHRTILQTAKVSRQLTRLVKPKRKYVKSELIRFILYKTIFSRLNTLITSSLKNLYGYNVASINTIFVCVPNSGLTAEFVAKYVTRRLQDRFPVSKLMNVILFQMRRLLESAQITGFKLVCSGRFARRGRASYLWQQCGKVAVGDTQLKVDYSLQLVTLANSICGIKVWITRTRQSNKLFII